ncbi:TRAP dicarboxylate transporter [Candidatus Scalindua japonica]|uniref:TRAP dicarboxylate transporter n=1 Tax=Candidatus Scalindua japonica TaxID=1284222 RepID=A0A286U159_9BACT|nr:hypothetical protein [Candidatus Scalindua japonica]GAX61856.1 TRAP dicarboxylate transporter [Candidatus Scalindua japonica]
MGKSTDAGSLGMLGSSRSTAEITQEVKEINKSGNNWVCGYVNVQHKKVGDLTIKCTGWNFSTPKPGTVICQARQEENVDNDWPDQFAIQVIETGKNFVKIRIRRIDKCADESPGWAQNLRIDITVNDWSTKE